MFSVLMPFLQLALLLLVGLVFIGLCVWGIGQVLDAFSQPASNPRQKLIGQLGRVTLPIADTQRGKVVVAGEVWDALPSESLGEIQLDRDTEIRVMGLDPVDPKVLRVTRQNLALPKEADS